MSENNGHANGSERVTAPTPTATNASGNGAARERIRVEISQREGVAIEAQPKAPAVPVIDEALDDSDLAVTVTVRVHGRTRVIANNCQFSTTVYEGKQDEMRAVLFQAIERLMSDARQAVSIKINRALPIPDVPPKERKGGGEEDGFLKEPLPRVTENQDAMEFLLHTPPELEPGMSGRGPRR